MQIELFVSNNLAFPTVNRTCESTGHLAHTVQRAVRIYIIRSLFFLSREFTNNNGPLSLAAKEKRDSSLAAAALKLAKKK